MNRAPMLGLKNHINKRWSLSFCTCTHNYIMSNLNVNVYIICRVLYNYNWFVCPWPPFIIRLAYDHLHSSHSPVKLWCDMVKLPCYWLLIHMELNVILSQKGGKGRFTCIHLHHAAYSPVLYITYYSQFSTWWPHNDWKTGCKAIL